MKLTVLADDAVKRVLKDGALVNANAYTNVLELDRGDVIIYTWEKNKRKKNNTL